jgi:hypothetical protein
MGLTGRASGRFIGHLENARIRNPSVKTIALFLRACGARWSQVTDLLEFSEPVEVDTRPIKDSGFDVRDRQRLEWAVEKQVRMFEAKLTMRSGCKPLRPGKQVETVRKLRNYRMVANIIEQAVSDLLSQKPLATIEYPAFKAVAREALGMLWREVRRSQNSKVKGQNRHKEAESKVQIEGSQDSEVKGRSSGESEKLRAKSKEQSSKSKDKGSQKSEVGRQRDEKVECRLQIAECGMQNGGVADKLAEKVEYWQMQKVNGELVREVQAVVIRAFRRLEREYPELFVRLV